MLIWLPRQPAGTTPPRSVRRHGSGTVEEVRDLKARHAAAYKKRAESEMLIEPDTVALVEELAGRGIPMWIVNGAVRLGLPACDIVVFEDSVVGVAAARAAGMRCIAVGGVDPADELRVVAPSVIDRLSPALLDGCFG